MTTAVEILRSTIISALPVSLGRLSTLPSLPTIVEDPPPSRLTASTAPRLDQFVGQFGQRKPGAAPHIASVAHQQDQFSVGRGADRRTRLTRGPGDAAAVEHLFPIILHGDVLPLLDQHRTASDRLLRRPEHGAGRLRSRRRGHIRIRTFVVVECGREGIRLVAVVENAVNPVRLEPSGRHLPERGAHGINRLIVTCHRLILDRLDGTAGNKQAQRVPGPPIPGIDRHTSRSPVGRSEFGMNARRGFLLRQMHGVEAQFGIGFQVGHGHESETLFSAAQIVRKLGYGQAGRIIARLRVGIGIRSVGKFIVGRFRIAAAHTAHGADADSKQGEAKKF